ncbi:ferredoxin [Actinobacteria bacterium YIM 96077]|uniref:Ferredoxin n=2 Tax=Phytoactinopolyspora halophila TaxID=1981511 RepID=A0A329QV53_9ACTN|nr:ferredoxin [Actinobacteria bacterium YIM 96077]RAW15489.1 ferredoxin [Phytoactinopolyspora halophila]
MKVIVDLEACQGYACCMIEAPEVFDLDESAGKATVLEEAPPEERREQVEAAVRNCPARAISLENG